MPAIRPRIREKCLANHEERGVAHVFASKEAAARAPMARDASESLRDLSKRDPVVLWYGRLMRNPRKPTGPDSRFSFRKPRAHTKGLPEKDSKS